MAINHYESRFYDKFWIIRELYWHSVQVIDSKNLHRREGVGG